MQAYVLASGRTIAPFDRPVGEMPIHNRMLSETQELHLRRHGCSVERIGALSEARNFPCLLVEDDLYFTHHALGAFLRAVDEARRSRQQENFQAALAQSMLTEYLACAFQGTRQTDSAGEPCRAYGLYALSSLDATRALADQCELLPVPTKIREMKSRVNRHFEPSGQFVIPISPVYLTPIQHWACLVAANMLGMMSALTAHARAHLGATLALPLKMVWRSGSLRPSRMFSKSYYAGQGCRIHPSAVVQGCLIGDRVTIQPNAVLTGSMIGDDAVIGTGACLDGCSIGREATVNACTVTRGTVAFDGANLGSFYNQFSVLGRDASMGPLSGVADFTLRGEVKVRHHGQMVNSGARFLGGCLGDRVFFGAGVKMMCGYDLPNECILILNPRTIAVRDVEKGVPGDIWRLDRKKRSGDANLAESTD